MQFSLTSSISRPVPDSAVRANTPRHAIPLQRRINSFVRGSVTRVRVAELIGPAVPSSPPGPQSSAPDIPPASSERFLDVGALLKEFNPLTESHLLRWGDSEDEEGFEQAELPEPLVGAWEDASSGYQGLEHQPSWIDYRAFSDSDDPDAATSRGVSGPLSALLPGLFQGGAEAQAQAGTPAPGSSPLAADTAALPSAYSAEAGFQEIAPHELEERLATGQVALLLDVRTRPEYESGHIAGAVNLPLDSDLSAAVRSGSLDEFRDRPVAVVCGGGGRAAQATVRLSKVFGWGNVMCLKGGVRAWRQEGMPVQVSPQRPAGASGGCGGGGGGHSCGCKSKPAA